MVQLSMGSKEVENNEQTNQIWKRDIARKEKYVHDQNFSKKFLKKCNQQN